MHPQGRWEFHGRPWRTCWISKPYGRLRWSASTIWATQLLQITRPAKPGRPRREDYDYQRRGTRGHVPTSRGWRTWRYVSRTSLMRLHDGPIRRVRARRVPGQDPLSGQQQLAMRAPWSPSTRGNWLSTRQNRNPGKGGRPDALGAASSPSAGAGRKARPHV